MDRIDKMTTALGCRTDVHRAAFLGLSNRTITRARRGDDISATFVANTIAALREHERALTARGHRLSFDELFEVVVIPLEVSGAA